MSQNHCHYCNSVKHFTNDCDFWIKYRSRLSANADEANKKAELADEELSRISKARRRAIRHFKDALRELKEADDAEEDVLQSLKPHSKAVERFEYALACHKKVLRGQGSPLKSSRDRSRADEEIKEVVDEEEDLVSPLNSPAKPEEEISTPKWTYRADQERRWLDESFTPPFRAARSSKKVSRDEEDLPCCPNHHSGKPYTPCCSTSSSKASGATKNDNQRTQNPSCGPTRRSRAADSAIWYSDTD